MAKERAGSEAELAGSRGARVARIQRELHRKSDEGAHKDKTRHNTGPRPVAEGQSIRHCVTSATRAAALP